jgi:hypothetical protein
VEGRFRQEAQSRVREEKASAQGFRGHATCRVSRGADVMDVHFYFE